MLQEENEELRQELERVKSELLRLEELNSLDDSRKHRSLRNAQTQELEDLMVENSQIAEHVRLVEEENANLKRMVERQREELKALEATDKTSVIEEDGGKKKSKLHLLRDKVNMMQKQMKEDHALGDMLSKERKLTKSLEKQLEDANARWKKGQKEVERIHDELLESEQQNRRHEEAYEELRLQLDELRAMKEAEVQARTTHAEHLNEQLMMLLTPTPVSDSNEGHFNFAPSRVSVQGGGQTLLSQLSHLPDSTDEEEEAPPVLDTPVTPVASPAPETAGTSQERWAEMQGECQRLTKELQICQQQLSASAELRAADARRELQLREQREAALAELQRAREELRKLQQEWLAHGSLAEMSDTAAEAQQLRQELAETKAQGDRLREDCAALRDECTAAKAMAAETQQLRRELAETKAQSDRLREDCARAIRHECAAGRAEIVRLQAALSADTQAAEDAQLRQLAETKAQSDRLREDCAKAIRDECAAGRAEILRLQAALQKAETQESEAQTTEGKAEMEVVISNVEPPPPVPLRLAGAGNAALPVESCANTVMTWKSETSVNSRVAELEEELEQLRKQLQKCQEGKAPEPQTWAQVINSFMCTSR